MTEQRTQALVMACLFGFALLVGCGEEGADTATGDGDAVSYGAVDGALLARLVEAHDQLEAGDWRAYLALRAEVAAGDHDGALVPVMGASDPVAARTAAVALEDRLVSGASQGTQAELAQAVLEAAVRDALTPALTPMASRTLGRLPRGTSQSALLDAHGAATHPTTRQMLLAALGDNADAQGLVELQARFAQLESCPEVRHATLAVRQADDALTAPESRDWLATVASPRVLVCADEVAEAGEAPDAELIALVAAHDQPAATTLVEEVLLGSVSRALKLRTLAILLASGDPAAGTVLADSVKELATQGLAAEVAEVIQALGGF